MIEKELKTIEERFNKIKPDYSIYFGDDGVIGLGCHLSNFSVDEKVELSTNKIVDYNK